MGSRSSLPNTRGRCEAGDTAGSSTDTVSCGLTGHQQDDDLLHHMLELDLAQYYKLAWNVSHLWKLASYMQTSLPKSLAHKHRSSITEIRKKDKTYTDNGHGQQVRCIEVVAHSKDGSKTYVARFCGIPSQKEQKRSSQRHNPIAIYGFAK